MTGLATLVVIALALATAFAGYRWMRRDSKISTSTALFGAAAIGIGGLIVYTTLSWTAFSLSSVYLDYLKLENIGFGARWTQEFGYKLWLFIAGMLITFIVMFGGTSLLKQRIRYGELSPSDQTNWYYLDLLMTWGGLIVSMIWSIRMGLSASRQWETFALRFNQVPFPTNDPVFGLNNAFYAFTLPFRSAILGWVFWVVFAYAVLTALTLLYIGARANAARVSASARALIGSQAKRFVGFILLMASVSGWNHRYWLLIDGSNPERLQGGSVVDVNVKIPLWGFFAIVLGVTGLLFILASLSRAAAKPQTSTGPRRPAPSASSTRSNLTTFDVIAGLGTAATLLVLIVVMFFPGIYWWWSIKNNVQARERPFVEYQLAGTKQAYNLPTGTSLYSPTATLTSDSLQQQDSTLAQTRIQDWVVFKASNSSRQFSKRQYGFPDADVIHVGDDSYVAALREMDTAQLDPSIRDWLNTHLVYTHGDGHVVARVNSLAPDGSADYLVSIVPPVSAPGLGVTRKGIYFGENSGDWVVVNTNTAEATAGNTAESYAGTTGIVVGNGFRRLVLALALDDWNFWRSAQITADSRLLIDRDPRTRVKAIAPFLATDPDVLPTFGGDQYNIMVDGLTTASALPYSDYFTLNYGNQAVSYDWIRYVRASVKGVVDAYDGTTTLYLVDATDPVALTWQNIFPGIFKSAGEMPAIVQQQLRYPESMFKLQTAALGEYHVTNPDIYWTGEDKWSVDTENYGADDGTIPIEPRYQMLPGAEGRDFILSQPMTYAPKNNQAGSPNMAAWISVGSELANYGQFRVLRMSPEINVPGVLQLENDLNGTPAIINDIALFDRGASRAYWGNMIVYPLETSSGPTMLYVKPLFTQGTQGSAIPQLARVYIIVNRAIYSGQNLQAALRNLYAGRAASRLENAEAGTPPPANPAQPAAQPAGPATSPISGTVTIDGSGLTPGQVEAIQRLIDEMRKGNGGR